MKNKKSKKAVKKQERKFFPDWSPYKKYSKYIILLITLGALIVRAYRVGYLSVWIDEYPHVLPAMKMVKGTFAWAKDGDFNGIFITWCVTLFYKIFGISETVARVPSVIFDQFQF